MLGIILLIHRILLVSRVIIKGVCLIMDFINIDFVQYHLSVLNGTVDISDYEKFFSQPLSDILTYNDDDLILAMELFGPYFAKGGLDRNRIKESIGLLLFDKLVSSGFTGTSDALSLFFDKVYVNRIEYDVSSVSGFILFSILDGYDVDYYYTYNFDVCIDGESNRTMVYFIKCYIFRFILECVSLYPPHTIAIDRLVNDEDYRSDELLSFYLKDATYSHTNSCFYEKIRDNAIRLFLWVMGDDRINERDVLIHIGAGVSRMDNVNRFMVTNEHDITYKQLLAPTMALLQNGKGE